MWYRGAVVGARWGLEPGPWILFWEQGEASAKLQTRDSREPVQYGLEDYFAAVGRFGGSGDQEAVAKVETMLLSPWKSLYRWGQLSALCGIGLLSSLKSRTGIVCGL